MLYSILGYETNRSRYKGNAIKFKRKQTKLLKKQNRLKNNKAFIATYKNHHIRSDDFICVYFGKEKTDYDRVQVGGTTPKRNSFNTSNQEAATSFKTKIAFVVSKKVHKRAVIRNHIKRLMREIIRLAIKNNSLPNLNNYISIICVAKQNSINASYENIKTSLYNILQSD